MVLVIEVAVDIEPVKSWLRRKKAEKRASQQQRAHYAGGGGSVKLSRPWLPWRYGFLAIR